MSNFDYLRSRIGFSFLIELVASCLSFTTRPVTLEIEFYNSRYSYTSEERSDSNNSISRQKQLDSNSLMSVDEPF
jgi:hypothetical protein